MKSTIFFMLFFMFAIAFINQSAIAGSTVTAWGTLKIEGHAMGFNVTGATITLDCAPTSVKHGVKNKPKEIKLLLCFMSLTMVIAIDFLKMRDEHNLDRSASQANYHLNRWARDKTADPHWMIDRRIINTLPDAIRRARAARRG